MNYQHNGRGFLVPIPIIYKVSSLHLSSSLTYCQLFRQDLPPATVLYQK